MLRATSRCGTLTCPFTRRRSMKKARTLVAAAVLAALPAMVAMQNTRTTDLRPRVPQARWELALGMEGWEAFGFGVITAVECAFIALPGAIACGIVGAA